MIKRLFGHFGTTLYVQIWENRIKVTNESTGAVYDEVPKVKIVTGGKGETSIAAIGRQADSIVESNAVIVNPLSHPRSLLKNFMVAEKLLQHAFQTLQGKKLIAAAPAVVIHPMEKTEGGLTDVERRAFRELALGAGARAVVVHEGEELYPRSLNFEALLTKETADSGAQANSRVGLVSTLLIIVVIVSVYLFSLMGQ